jgi:NADAR domain
MLEALLSTNGLLVEASSNDAIWGIGLAEADAKSTPSHLLPGLNLLVRILTQVRDEIRSGMHDELLPGAVKEILSLGGLTQFDNPIMTIGD